MHVKRALRDVWKHACMYDSLHPCMVNYIRVFHQSEYICGHLKFPRQFMLVTIEPIGLDEFDQSDYVACYLRLEGTLRNLISCVVIHRHG